MKLFYTTAGEQDTPQAKPSQSLGGYKSSSPVQNNIFDNLFGELSMNTIKDNRDEFIGLMLVNDSISDLTGVNIYFEHPVDSYSEYKIGAIIPALDVDGFNYIEQIPSRNSQPLYIEEFVTADIDNRFDIGDMDAGVVVGVWVKRELLIDFIKSDSNDLYSQDPENPRIYLPKEKATQDSINIIISWD